MTVCQKCDGSDNVDIYTDLNGFYSLDVPTGTYTIAALIPTGMEASRPNVGVDDSIDSDGVQTGGFSVAPATTPFASDFGLFAPSLVQQPGTGTPGYWKNHPEAWPVESIPVGGVVYSKDDAIIWLGKVGKDKTTTMFSSLVPAMLNVLIGNQSTCVNDAIAAANRWLVTYPLGSKVAASSYAWTIGEPWHIQLDSYNNGLLCAPHRQ